MRVVPIKITTPLLHLRIRRRLFWRACLDSQHEALVFELKSGGYASQANLFDGSSYTVS